ncbi:MAG: 16S rRNA (guanine(527)-N(7))-methyltransferase RsmG [Chloroflexota bacterium]
MERLIAGAIKLGVHLSPVQIEQFETFYRLLVEWNQRINLTSVIDYEEVQVKHFLDSLTVILTVSDALNDSGAALDMIDVGAGAGLPGIPLKLVLPRSRLVLLDSVGKKVSFLRELVRRLGLDQVEIVTDRAETAAHQTPYREKFNLVLARALARLPVAAELTLPFCRHQGITVHHKKGDIASELNEAEAAIKILGGNLREVVPIELDELPDSRCLVVIEKVYSTPGKYPRRAGIPQKRPIE